MGELGSLLTRAREARGLTLEDAERDTRISRRYLQALEAEQFEVIPAPVYARGFLRSYSQYLGIDPQEALAMFPREDDPDYQRPADGNAQPQRASRETPVSPVSAARPSWRRTPPAGGTGAAARQQAAFPETAREEAVEAPRRPTPLGRPRPQPAPAEREPGWEPVIGIDIGLPSPAHRVKTDPAAQTRSVVVAIVALAVILGVVALAVIISNLGGSENPPPGTGLETTQAAGQGLAATSTDTPSAGDVTPGVVPDVGGLQEADASARITAAGFVPRVLRVANSAEKGTVLDQSPAAGIEYPRGQEVRIAVSEGR